MATLITQTISQAGMSPSLQAATITGDSYTPESNVFLLFKNGDTNPHVATIHTTASIFGQPISNIAVSLAAGSEVLVGPFDPAEVQQSGSTLANITYDGVTSITVAAIRCPSV